MFGKTDPTQNTRKIENKIDFEIMFQCSGRWWSHSWLGPGRQGKTAEKEKNSLSIQ